MSTMPSVGSGTYSPGPNMVCSPEQEKVGTGSIEAIICPVYGDLRIRATVSKNVAIQRSRATRSIVFSSFEGSSQNDCYAELGMKRSLPATLFGESFYVLLY